MAISRSRVKYTLFLALIGAARVLVLLPRPLLLALGRALARLYRRLDPHRRYVTDRNLAVCFPELSPAERERVAREAFEGVGMSAFEHLIAWFQSPRRFDRIPFEMEGLEHLEAARRTGRGVLLCAGHFTCTEICARAAGTRIEMGGVGIRHSDPGFERFWRRRRASYVRPFIPHDDVRAMLRALSSGSVLWYLPDQDLGIGERTMARFFGVPVAGISAPPRLVRRSGALLVPFSFRRLPENRGYACRFHPAFEDYPSDSIEADLTRWYAWLEEEIRRAPGQYLWTHRMFKTRPPGAAPIYADPRFRQRAVPVPRKSASTASSETRSR